MNGGGSRVPAAAGQAIPAGFRKTIENIREITGNHSDEEIYAMLRECSMDPNETAQKLLLQDTFHEVKRKHNKKKEVNKESVDPKFRTGMRGARGGRGSFSSRYFPNGGRNVTSGKENELNMNLEKGNNAAPPPISESTEIKATNSISGPATAVQSNGPIIIDHPRPSQGRGTDFKAREKKAGPAPSVPGEKKPGPAPSVSTDRKAGAVSSVTGEKKVGPTGRGESVLGAHPSASDPVLVLALDSRSPRAAGTIRRPVGSQRAGSGVSTTTREVSQATAPSSSHGRPSSSRPSSSYSGRGPPSSGLQRVAAGAPNKEWKPKSTSVGPTQPPENSNAAATTSSTTTAEAVSHSVPTPDPEESNTTITATTTTTTTNDNNTAKVERKLAEIQLAERQHVIIPNHLQVPESEKCRLSFGSFDSTFDQIMGFSNGPTSEKNSELAESDLSQGLDDTSDEPTSSTENAPSIVHVSGKPGHQQSPMRQQQVSENYPSMSMDTEPSSNADVAGPDQELKEEEEVSALAPPDPPVQTSYSTFGQVNQMLGGTHAQPLESSDTVQSRDSTGRVPNVMVQQPFDISSSYYTQFYRPTSDADGRFSPFLAPGGAIKYGNISVMTGQTGQPPQEGVNSVVLPSSASPAIPTPAGGMIPNSISVPQQPVQVFRQPVGVHISHYPPNYLPYNQYISPFYVPPPALHPSFLGNTYPQQATAAPGGGLPAAPSGGVPAVPPVGVRYSMSPYKPGGNAVGGLAGVGYGSYGSAGYAAGALNPGESDDLGGSQFKENSVYIATPQSEGSAVWIPAPGRDLSSLQASSFYGLPPQGGQHLAFAPSPGQATGAPAGHSPFTGIYHHPAAAAQTVAGAAVHPLLQPSQALAGTVEMVGPTGAGVYPQAQRAQVNWANNY